MARPFSISPDITRAQARNIIAFATATADPLSENSGSTRVTNASTCRGSRVLPGRYGLEGLAIGIPKGREAAMPLVTKFVADAKASGAVAQAVECAGLRGTVLSN